MTLGHLCPYGALYVDNAAQDTREQEQGMYRSSLGRQSLRVGLVMGLLIGLCSLLLLAACGGQNSAKGGAGQEHKKSTSGDSDATNGQIVFRRYLDPDQSKGAIFTMNPDGSHVSQITPPPDGWSDETPVWSPDGMKVAFYRGCLAHCEGSRIMVVDANTGDTRKVTHCMPDGGWTKEHPTPSSGHYCVGDSEAAFSPDGKMLVFDRERRLRIPKLGGEENFYHAVFLQPIDSSGKPEDAHRITPWKMNCQDHPEYSPDAKLVLFRCLPEGEDGPSNLYWVHPDGTGLHQITHSPKSDEQYYLGSSFSPTFSEEEGWITAGRQPGYGEDDNADVYRLLIKDGEVVRSVNITKSAIWDSGPVWGSHPPVG